MAAILSSTPVYRHIVGDLAVRFFTLSGGNGDTLSVTGISDILNVTVTPTTAISVGATWTGSTVTFVTGGAWAGTAAVYSRVG